MRYVNSFPTSVLCALLGTFLLPQQSYAETLIVDAPTAYVAADGQCSLVEAIDNANADSIVHADCPAGTGADDIVLTAGVTLDGTAIFDANGPNGLPSLTGATRIDGAGFTIMRDAGAPSFRLLHVAPGTVAELHRLRLTGGRQDVGFDNGGGVYNAGTLLVSESTIDNSTVASIFPSGGGIYSTGDLTIANSSVSGNTVVDDTFSAGGGIDAATGGSLTLINVEVSNNSARSGAGVRTLVPTTIDNSLFADNMARDSGGGILLFGTLDPVSYRINNSRFDGNVVTAAAGGTVIGGGAIANGGDDTAVFGSTFTNNTVADTGLGGAILNVGGRVVVDASVFDGNSAQGSALGGALANVFFGGEFRLTGSIVRNNSSVTEGGGLYTIASPFYVTDSLIEGNSANAGGGLSAGASNGDAFFVERTTITGNTASFLGGGLYAVGNQTTSFIENSTISGNTSTDAFGGGVGLNQGGQVQITHTAVIDNEALTFVNSIGGLSLFAGTGTLGSNLIANNPNGDCSATSASTSLDYNISTGPEVIDPLFGNDRWCSFIPSAPNDLLATDPLVEPLAANGNVGPTHLLQANSPAANYIPFDCPPSLDGVDQRGVARPPGSCDVGPISDEAAVLPTVYFPLASSEIDDEGSFPGTHFVDLVVDNTAGTLTAPGLDLRLNVSITGTAAPGVDYVPDVAIPTVFAFGPAEWPAPGTTGTVQIGLTPIPDDLVENDETIVLSVRLTGPGVLGAQTEHVVTLLDARRTIYACDGFLPPFTDPLSFGQRPPRSIPAKMHVIAPDGSPATPDDLPATPEIFVVGPDGTVYGNPDADDDALAPVGRSNVGNAFAFDPDDVLWHYRVGTGQFPAPGVYTVSARFPADSDAIFDPTCTQTFERQSQ